MQSQRGYVTCLGHTARNLNLKFSDPLSLSYYTKTFFYVCFKCLHLNRQLGVTFLIKAQIVHLLPFTF